jgi:hypothetical protein
VTYVLLASATEDAFTDASTYLLHLVIAASLIVVPLSRQYDSRTISASEGIGD